MRIAGYTFLVALLLAACSPTPHAKSATARAPGDIAKPVGAIAETRGFPVDPPTKVQYVTFDPYPSAASVRLYVDPGFKKRAAGADLEPAGGHLLTDPQRAEFEASIRPFRVIGDDQRSMAACFIPHHFFRYFDGAGRQLGEVAVWFCCGGVQLTPDAGYQGEKRDVEYDAEWLGRLIQKLGYRVDIDCR